MDSLELFAANTRSFQVKKLFGKKKGTTLEEAQFIWTNLDSRFGQKK